MPRKYLDLILLIIFSSFFGLVFKKQIYKIFFLKHQIQIGEIKSIGKEVNQKELNSSEFENINHKKKIFKLYNQDIIEAGNNSKALITVGSLFEVKLYDFSKAEFQVIELDKNSKLKNSSNGDVKEKQNIKVLNGQFIYQININSGTFNWIFEKEKLDRIPHKLNPVHILYGEKRITIKPHFEDEVTKVEFITFYNSNAEFGLKVKSGNLLVHEANYNLTSLNEIEDSNEIIMDPHDLYPSDQLSSKSKTCYFIEPTLNEVTEWFENWNNYLIQWSKDGNCFKYEIELSLENDFKKIIWSKKLNSLSVMLDEDIKADEIYWRVIGFSKTNKKVATSKPIKLIKKQLIPPAFTIPTSNQIFYIKKGKKNTRVNFAWESKLDSEVYEFEISTDSEFKNLIKTDSTPSKESTVKDLGPGSYFIRIKSKSQNRPETPWSQSVSFRVVL